MTELALRFPPTLVMLTAILCFVAFLAAFRLAERGREGSVERRSGWTFMSGVVAGAGFWSGQALPLIAYGPAARFSVGLTVAALVVAILTAILVMTLWTGRKSLGRAVFSALVAAAGLKLVSVLTVLSIAMDRPADLFSGPLLGSFLAVVVVVFIAALSSRSTGETSMLRSSALLVGAVMLASDVMIGGAVVPEGAMVVLGSAQINGNAIVVLVAVISFLAIGTGMATALIDRDGQYESLRRLHEMADATVEGLVILDSNRIVDVNESFLRIVDLTREEVRGQPFVGEMLFSDISPDRVPAALVEGQLMASHNRLVPVEVVPRPIRYQGRPHTVFAVRDLSDRRDAEVRIRYLADHDSLTGLPNRASFHRELERRCEANDGAGLRFALFCVDLDRFKEANDVFGHLAGDEVLVQVGVRLRELLGPSAFVARLGGDEFAVLMSDLPSPRIVGDVADEIVSKLSAPFVFSNQRIGVGASVGIAMAPSDGDRPDLLLARADMALYRAKNEGRGSYRFFEESMDEETRLRRTLAFELRDAIDRDELQLVYQPLADVGSQKILGFEALARWHHPRHGTISPTVFIAIAEESGFIAQLGAWVLRTACAEAASWDNPLRIAVNLSPVQLEQQNLPEVLHEVLFSTGLSPQRLELEVTETSLLRNPQRALDVLRRMKALGVRIAMDDFGTGYSSLSTLQAFPFDKLKIDRSFVDRVASSEQAASIVRAVVGLSRSLDIKVLAEGVETESQFAFLVDEACDEVQGYMFGRPMPIDTYEAFTMVAPDESPAVDRTPADPVVTSFTGRGRSTSDPARVAGLTRARS